MMETVLVGVGSFVGGFIVGGLFIAHNARTLINDIKTDVDTSFTVVRTYLEQIASHLEAAATKEEAEVKTEVTNAVAKLRSLL